MPGDSCLSNPILSISMCSGLLLRRLRVSPSAPAALSVERDEGESGRVGWRVSGSQAVQRTVRTAGWTEIRLQEGLLTGSYVFAWVFSGFLLQAIA